MFIELSRNRLKIEATPQEWADLRQGLHTLGDDNRAKRELDFAIMTILQQEAGHGSQAV